MPDLKTQVESKKHFNPNGEAAFFRLMNLGGFEIDSGGRIWKLRDLRSPIGGIPYVRRRAERDKGRGYLSVWISERCVSYAPLAHRLVFIHFHGSIPTGLTVNHEDGVKGNNNPDNLTLATDSDQMRHARDVLGNGGISLERFALCG